MQNVLQNEPHPVCRHCGADITEECKEYIRANGARGGKKSNETYSEKRVAAHKKLAEKMNSILTPEMRSSIRKTAWAKQKERETADPETAKAIHDKRTAAAMKAWEKRRAANVKPS